MFGAGRARTHQIQHADIAISRPPTLAVDGSARTSRNEKPSAWTKGLQNSTGYESLYLVGKVGDPPDYGSEG